MARKLVYKILETNSLEAYVTCRVISLNKNSGFRTIVVGKVFKRIIGKVIAWILKGCVQEVAGPLQTVKLREKCPNAELFLVPIQENTDQK